MMISSFDDLLLAACEQPQGQRLLLVFAAAELPDDATPEQRDGFAQGAGGALVPIMCVDQTPEEIGNFERLMQQAGQFETPWRRAARERCSRARAARHGGSHQVGGFCQYDRLRHIGQRDHADQLENHVDQTTR